MITRPGDPPGGLYEIDLSDTDCQDRITVASKHCPDALLEIQAKSAVGRAANIVAAVLCS